MKYFGILAKDTYHSIQDPDTKNREIKGPRLINQRPFGCKIHHQEKL